MITEQLTIPVEAALLQEAQERVGSEGLATFINDALRYYLQALRFREVEAELAAKYGPISEEAKRRVAELDWTF